MSQQAPVAGDVLTGAVDGTPAPGGCRNCGAPLAGAYCAACGQPAHLHRSLSAMAHDLLHGVLHFEGRLWRTLPQLFWHPGRLTRRYIDGERAKFVSPIALFLFAVFLTFAVLPFTGAALLGGNPEASAQVARGGVSVSAGSSEGLAPALRRANEEVRQRTAELQQALAAPDLGADQRAALEEELARLRDTGARLDGIAAMTWLGTGTLADAVRRAMDNPRLLAYRLKTNGYKFSWALIPLSLPFMWLLFCTRRGLPLYDHAIFVTYSIAFMMFLLVLLSLTAAAGVPEGLWSTALMVIPLVHLYRQLRGAYGVTRLGALWRLAALLVIIAGVMMIFIAGLLVLGVLD